MYERLLITFGVIVFVWAVLSIMKRRQITLSNRASQRLQKQRNVPTIVYFWSDGCALCKTAQKPILEGILAEYGNERIALTTYNVEESPDVAKEWGVRTLPTTFLLDSTGTVKHTNNGPITSANLRRQLEAIQPMK